MENCNSNSKQKMSLEELMELSYEELFAIAVAECRECPLGERCEAYVSDEETIDDPIELFV